MNPFPGILGPNGQPIVSLDRVRQERLSRFNPLANWTPEILVRQLTAYARGEIAPLSWIMEWLEIHDEVIQTVAPKAKAAVSRHGHDVVFKEEVRPEQKQLAEDQQGKVREFYQSLKVGDAVDLEVAGGTRLLYQQVMDAYAKGYAAHHIVWKPGTSLTAELLKVPTWFFEVKTGRMQFLPSTWAINGIPLDTLGGRDAWMISRGRGVMLAGCIARMFKQLPLQDWLTYCDRHGMPAYVGKSKAKQGSDEWNQLRNAVASIGSEWGAVINVDDLIDVIDLKGSGELPYEKLVDRMDRALVMLWRGGDLGTISRSNGTGSNPQDAESDDLDADNSTWVSETLNRNLTDRVVRYYYGDAPVLVELELRTASRDDIAQDLKILTTFTDMGERVSATWATGKFGVILADDADRALGEYQTPEKAPLPEPTPPENQPTVPNTQVTGNDAMQALRDALAEDMQPLGDALWQAYQSADLPAMRAALRKISNDIQGLAGNATALGNELEGMLVDSLLGKDFPEAPITSNAGNTDGAIKGWATRRASGWQSQPQAANQNVKSLVDDALDNHADNRDSIALFGDVSPEEARLLGLPPGFKRGMSRHSIRHIYNSHGNPALEDPRGQIAVTREDIANIPETIAKSQAAVHSGTSGNVQTIRYYLDDAQKGTTTVVDEVRSGRKRLIPVQLMKFKKPGVRVPLTTEGKA